MTEKELFLMLFWNVLMLVDKNFTFEWAVLIHENIVPFNKTHV